MIYDIQARKTKKKRNEVFDAKLGSLNKYSGTVAAWMVLDMFQLSSTQKVWPFWQSGGHVGQKMTNNNEICPF